MRPAAGDASGDRLDDQIAKARLSVYEAFRGVQNAAPPMPTDIPFMLP